MVNTLVFPSDFYNKRSVDPALRAEYEAAVATGLFRIILFSYDKLAAEGVVEISDTTSEECTAVYRGWMLKPDQYSLFYEELLKRRIRLVTSPEQYQLMHVFLNVYEHVKEDTARMKVFPLYQQISVEDLKKAFVRFMVKDYVKSVKGTDFPKYFDRSVTQEQFDSWMRKFYEYRGKLLTGGICIKEYLDLKRYGNKTNEYRVFYINHEIATISRNSGQGIYAPMPPQKLISKYRFLESPYYTVDYAELSDGTWVVIEAGDGSVSGLSDGQDYEVYFRTLYHCFEEDR